MDSRHFLVACGFFAILVGIVFVANSQDNGYQQKAGTSQPSTGSFASISYCRDASGACKPISESSNACPHGGCSIQDYRLQNPPAGTSCSTVVCPDGLQGKSCKDGATWANNCDINA